MRFSRSSTDCVFIYLFRMAILSCRRLLYLAIDEQQRFLAFINTEQFVSLPDKNISTHQIFQLYHIVSKMTRQECAICFDALTILSQVVRTPCGHIFHQLCISRLLRIQDSTISYLCPLCRAPLPVEISAFTPVSSGLPEGEARDVAEQDTEYIIEEIEEQTPRNDGANDSLHRSPLQFIRGIFRQRAERRQARISAIERHGNIDQYFLQSFNRFRWDFLQRQANLEIRTSRFEDLLGRQGQHESFANELLQERDNILREHDRLRTDHRVARLITTRQRRSQHTRRRVLQAWDRAWPGDVLLQFEQRQQLLLRRVSRLSELRLPRERLENLD